MEHLRGHGNCIWHSGTTVTLQSGMPIRLLHPSVVPEPLGGIAISWSGTMHQDGSYCLPVDEQEACLVTFLRQSAVWLDLQEAERGGALRVQPLRQFTFTILFVCSFFSRLDTRFSFRHPF